MNRDWPRRNASAKTERDRKIELALTHELRAAGTPDRDSCVDAETLGAWADGGLDAAQMASVELHVSSCARCQAIVGATARATAAVTPVVTEGRFRVPRWVLAPLAAAAAVTIWMVVPQETMRDSVTPAQPPAAARSDSAPAIDPGPASQSKEAAAAPTASVPATPPATLTGRRQRGADAPAQLQDRQQPTEERAAANLGAAAAAPPPPPAPAAATSPAPPPALAETIQLQKGARLAAGPFEIVSPDPSSRWRIVSNAIERSEDGGASWTPIRAPGGESITGGVSPARSICWLIGASGLVMVTADGVAFARVPVPDGGDLIAITASDARTATVTTADGRRFRTDDSGRSWRQIPA